MDISLRSLGGTRWIGVHILWAERALDERLREKFFPGAKQSHALNYAILRDGKIELRRTLAIAEEGGSELKPGPGRFHITPDNRLFVVYFIEGTDASGKSVAENRCLKLLRAEFPGPQWYCLLRNPFPVSLPPQ